MKPFFSAAVRQVQLLKKEKPVKTLLTTALVATFLAGSSAAFATDTGGTTTGTNSTGTTTNSLTDDATTGSVQNPSLSPADRERCKTAPASDTTCKGMNQGTDQQQ